MRSELQSKQNSAETILNDKHPTRTLNAMRAEPADFSSPSGNYHFQRLMQMRDAVNGAAVFRTTRFSQPAIDNALF
jgi:hypothetical protein